MCVCGVFLRGGGYRTSIVGIGLDMEQCRRFCLIVCLFVCLFACSLEFEFGCSVTNWVEAEVLGAEGEW